MTIVDDADDARIRVKFLARPAARLWRRQLPDAAPLWGDCVFSFDPEDRDYDWLVVYDDLPTLTGERHSRRSEHLACPPANTLLITTEPSSIKLYGSAYTAQFAQILTSQEAWALPHPARIHAQPALRWFYGAGSRQLVGYDELCLQQAPTKSALISTVCSAKRQTHTLHRQRHAFTTALQQQLPELDWYGHGVRDMDDKAVALDAYRYHVVIENHLAPHHWTEKLADAFLGYCLPFYHGCPNAEDYFPPDSFIRIDLDDIDKSLSIIRQALADNAYEQRLPAIIEARRRVLERYNIFAVIHDIVHTVPATHLDTGAREAILSRRAVVTTQPLAGLRFLLEKVRARMHGIAHD